MRGRLREVVTRYIDGSDSGVFLVPGGHARRHRNRLYVVSDTGRAYSRLLRACILEVWSVVYAGGGGGGLNKHSHLAPKKR